MALDSVALERLRTIVRELEAANRGGMSLADVVHRARTLHLDSGVTVDFQATAALGQPMIVVRVPSVPATESSFAALTPRERQIARLIADGLSNKQIAARLHITLGTVKHHVHQILDKTGLAGRVAVATAAQATFFDAGPPSIFG